MRPLLAVAVVLLVASAAASAAIYKWRLPDGEIVYSDRPPAGGAEKLELRPLQTYTPPASERAGINPEAAAPGAKAGAEAGYTDFRVTRPANEEALRDNSGAVSITLALKPALAAGDKIEIYMDGKAIGSGRSTSLTVTRVDRGTHTVYATVKGASGKVLAKTSPVTFHLLRVHL